MTEELRAEREELLTETVGLLTDQSEVEKRMAPCGTGTFPYVPALREMIDIARRVIFYDFLDRRRNTQAARTYTIGAGVENIFNILRKEIRQAITFESCPDCENSEIRAARLAMDFIRQIPEIKRILFTDVQAMYENDPAVDNFGEIVLSYPVINAMLHYRIAHALLQVGVPVIPRLLTELAHSQTGIDINPGASIGEHFAIDHGTGVVIGQTCIIGHHVTLYQGVTLGAKNFTLDADGHPVNVPRHPIIEDNVTIYANASILGRITVGRDSIIGGNVWLTYSVPPGSRIMQRKAISSSFTDGGGI